MLSRFLDLLFPPRCLSCRTPVVSAAETLCAPCLAAIPLESTLRCGRCFARIPEAKKICHKDFPYLLGAAAPYRDPRVRALVHGLKFRHAHAAAGTLSSLLENFLKKIPMPLDSFVLVPIPLSLQRRRKRGYNQSEFIAEHLSAALGIPVASEILLRQTHTKPQSELSDWEERRTNVAGAFAVPNPEAIQKKDCILIDDVTTSGATFFEAAKALKSAGARRIVALAAARA